MEEQDEVIEMLEKLKERKRYVSVSVACVAGSDVVPQDSNWPISRTGSAASHLLKRTCRWRSIQLLPLRLRTKPLDEYKVASVGSKNF